LWSLNCLVVTQCHCCCSCLLQSSNNRRHATCEALFCKGMVWANVQVLSWSMGTIWKAICGSSWFVLQSWCNAHLMATSTTSPATAMIATLKISNHVLLDANEACCDHVSYAITSKKISLTVFVLSNIQTAKTPQTLTRLSKHHICNPLSCMHKMWEHWDHELEAPKCVCP